MFRVMNVSVLMIVAAATVAVANPTLDLTSVGSSGTINGALFEHATVQSTGTGVIDSFVRVQKNNSEQGYNTDGAFYYDEKGGQFTHSIVIADIPVMTIGGVDYREFLLDINQTDNKSLLTLDEIQIYLATSGNLTGPVSVLGTPIYDLDALGDSYILLDYTLEPGSGGGDMRAYIPDALFVGNPTSTYVYLYSQFGLDTEDLDAETNAGFEEWAVRKQTPPVVPAPAAMVLASIGMGLVGFLRRRGSL